MPHLYHATEVFCERNYSYKNDALGKTVGQMIGAARSARQNIVKVEAGWMSREAVWNLNVSGCATRDGA